MLKLNKITIENFRGIKLPLTIDFVKGGKHTSALVYGRNGTGKSSISEAWEWLNTFRIERLEGRDGVSATDHPHKSSKGVNAYVEVEFQHPTINLVRSTFNPKKITAPTISAEYANFKNKSKYPNYLRYADLQDFVYKTKTEKYRYIAKYFGLEVFTKNQSDIQASLNRLSTILKAQQESHDIAINTITMITGMSTIDEPTIIGFINKIGAKHSLPAITEFKKAESIKGALEKIVQNNPITKELTEWRAFQIKQNQFYPVVSIEESSKRLESIFSELKKNEESIKQLVLADLYELSLEIIPQLDNKTQCPVCDTVFNGDLLNHITEKHTALSILLKKKNEYEAAQAALLKQCEDLSKKITLIESESSVAVLSSLKSFFDELKAINVTLPDIIATLRKAVKDTTTIEISKDPSIATIDRITDNEASCKKIVADRIKALETDEKSKNLARDYGNVLNIISGYKAYLLNKEKVDYLRGITTNLETLLALLTAYIQTTIQTTFTSISADVVDCFNTLEPANPFIKNPQLTLIAGKDKAVELEIEFITEKVIPAFKYLSESQVNSFGLSIFLASVKHFNTEFKFFVLDDIVNSFDAFKRPRVSQLIANKFSDYQVLMLTHDQVFFDTMQRDFPNWQRYKFTSWDYSTGPRTRLAKNYAEEIEEYIEEDKPIAAGQALGRYLEWTFGVVNENIQTPMRYKTENVYTLSEFYDPLVKRFRDKLKSAGKQHKLIQLFEQFEQGTIFRNYCAHWKNEANPFTSLEIDGIFKKWREIEKTIYCESCKSFVNLDSTTGTEYVKCNCGVIDLKDTIHYS